MSIPKEQEQVMKVRGGSVLGKRTILKSDHFPGCQNKRLSPQIDGALNYRQADSLRVHGVAIPTVVGIQNVLKHIGAQKDGKQAHVLGLVFGRNRCYFFLITFRSYLYCTSPIGTKFTS
ncbi:hypothetical protein CRYUN_Cryun23aG0117900 [Craigia yunnanensis]